MDVLRPNGRLLAKLGSIVIHAEEVISPKAHLFDKAALEQLLKDPEVIAWLKILDAMALIPKKR